MAIRKIITPNILINGPGRSSEAMTLTSLDADLKGHSILDIGHAQIDNMELSITDTSAIVLSGQALRKFGNPGRH